MRAFAIVVLLLSSVLLAETQEAAYFRAMKAEEAGDVTLALEAFEEAAALPGPYTEEIRGIIKEYYSALGMDDLAEDEKSPWSFRVLGDLGIYGLRYSEFGGVDEISEYGGDLFFSLTPFLDYSTDNWIHSFGVGVSGDWFLANDNMPALDTNDWKFTLGLEYALVGKTLMIDLGADLNFEQGEDVSPAFYGWIEKDFYRVDKHRFGVAAWGFYDADGPLTFALYGAWHRTAPYGWNAAVFLGARFEADSATDYVGYLEALEAAYSQLEPGGGMCWDGSDCTDSRSEFENRGGNGFGSRNPMDACLETYGEECFDWEIATVDSIYWAEHSRPDSSTQSVNTSSVSVDVPRYYAKWFGPTLRSRISYKFKRNITLEARLNLFYGFVLDGPDEDYEKIGKFSMTGGGLVSWKPGPVSLYLGIEQFYKRYNLPDYYVGVYPKNTTLTELKAGIKWDL